MDELQPDTQEEDAPVADLPEAPVTSVEATLMSPEQRMARAARALMRMGVEALDMAPGTLAHRLSEATGVGYDASLAVALSIPQRFPPN